MLKIKNIEFKIVWVIFILLLAALHSNAQTQTKIKAKKINQIRQDLNEFKVYEALAKIDKLLAADPYSAYYNELKTNVLKQIIEKINYAKDNTDATVQTSYLDANNNLVQDTLDWENESDSAMLQFVTKPNVNAIIDTLASKKNVEEASKKESKNFDALTNTKPKKKKKWYQFDDIEKEPEATTYIDSSLAQNKELTDAEEKAIADVMPKSGEGNETKTEETGMPAGFEKSKSKQEKLQQKLLEIEEKLAKLDAKQFSKMLEQHARLSTLYVEYPDSAADYLMRLITDSSIAHKIWKDSAVTLLESGDEHLAVKEFEEALSDYNQAAILEPNYIPLYLKMGSTYYMLGEDSMCKQYFTAAMQLDSLGPNTLFYLSQFYFGLGDYKKSLENVCLAIMRYPNKLYFDMIKNIADKTANDYNSQWIPRFVFPITMKTKMEEIVVKDKNPWFYYQSAKMDYAHLANEKGIIKQNETTRERYLEVVCLQNMLDSTTSFKELKFARDMRKIGYLDCYALVSLFHADLYDQFKDLAANHPEKIMKYLYMLLNWHKHKFDAVKLEPTSIQKDADKKSNKKK